MIWIFQERLNESALEECSKGLGRLSQFALFKYYYEQNFKRFVRDEKSQVMKFRSIHAILLIVIICVTKQHAIIVDSMSWQYSYFWYVYTSLQSRMQICNACTY
jgi:hypothetical protein